MSDEVTPDALIRRLLVLHGAEKLDDLRGNVPNSLRTLQRWKEKGWPQNATALLTMLNDAGYLTDREPDPAMVSQARARVVAKRIADDVHELVDLL